MSTVAGVGLLKSKGVSHFNLFRMLLCVLGSKSIEPKSGGSGSICGLIGFVHHDFQLLRRFTYRVSAAPITATD